MEWCVCGWVCLCAAVKFWWFFLLLNKNRDSFDRLLHFPLSCKLWMSNSFFFQTDMKNFETFELQMTIFFIAPAIYSFYFFIFLNFQNGCEIPSCDWHVLAWTDCGECSSSHLSVSMLYCNRATESFIFTFVICWNRNWNTIRNNCADAMRFVSSFQTVKESWLAFQWMFQWYLNMNE